MSSTYTRPTGYRQLTWTAAGVSSLNSTSAPAISYKDVGAPAGVPPRSGKCYFFVDAGGANMRFRDDGIAPTISMGVPVVSGMDYTGDMSLIQIYAPSGTKLGIFYTE